MAITVKTKLPAGVRCSNRCSATASSACCARATPCFVSTRFTLQRYLALEHLLVAPGGSPGNYVDTELSRRGLTRRVALQVSSFLVAPQLVAESDLISTGPALLLRRVSAHHPVVLLKAPLPLPRFELCLVWHTRRDSRSGARHYASSSNLVQSSCCAHRTDVYAFRLARTPGAEQTSQVTIETSPASAMAAFISGCPLLREVDRQPAELLLDLVDLEVVPGVRRQRRDRRLEAFEEASQDRAPALEAFESDGTRHREPEEENRLPVPRVPAGS